VYSWRSNSFSVWISTMPFATRFANGVDTLSPQPAR
jgi:hypothetical protein